MAGRIWRIKKVVNITCLKFGPKCMSRTINQEINLKKLQLLLKMMSTKLYSSKDLQIIF